MNSNLVHSYITGSSFKNIYGGSSPDLSGSITHIQYLTPLAQQRWPWIKNQWHLSDHCGSIGYFQTLREAKQHAQKLWPECGFKTPTQFRRELQE